MKITIIYILLSIFIFPMCKNYDKLIINASEINTIEIYKINGQKLELIKKINDTNEIKKISSCIENSRKEILKFIPKYKLIFHCTSSDFSLVINGSAMSFKDGYKYRLKCDLEDLIIK